MNRKLSPLILVVINLIWHHNEQLLIPSFSFKSHFILLQKWLSSKIHSFFCPDIWNRDTVCCFCLRCFLVSAIPSWLCSQQFPTNYNSSHPKVRNFTVLLDFLPIENLIEGSSFKTHCQSMELKDTLLTTLCYILRNNVTPGLYYKTH